MKFLLNILSFKDTQTKKGLGAVMAFIGTFLGTSDLQTSFNAAMAIYVSGSIALKH